VDVGPARDVEDDDVVRQPSGEMLNVWLPPQFTATVPLGLMDPPAPAEARIECEFGVKLAAMVWFADTLVNV